MNALRCLLIDEQEREQNETLFRDYMGQCLWHITTIQHLKTSCDNSIPQYIELAHPELMPKEENPEEVKERILSKLTLG